ncbi:MAG: alpha-L-rhamnosidase N-terminal domain-containing protein [Bacteroidales bacterium]|nr:alpha-L-rhamnosidase N-terminal domain-containing protein [Bacteroidales bacterium]
MKKIIILVALCATVVGCNCTKSTIAPQNLTTEYQKDAFTDVVSPRFSWVNVSKKAGAAQTSYHIRVFTDPANPEKTSWDSGIVISKESVLIPYKGKALGSCTDYYWQVQVRDEKGEASKWSEVCHFHTGVLLNSIWQAQWIGAPWQGEESYDYDRSEDVQSAPLLRKEFEISKPVKSARFYGTGLGYFELYVNGSKMGDEYLVPNQTNYGYREKLEERLIPVPDPFNGYSVAYVSYDLKDALVQGTNAVGAILGNGFYDLVFRRFVMGYGVPKFYGQIVIKYEDGTTDVIASDPTWKIAKSAILYDQMYIGEQYDARAEHDGWSKPGYDDSAWESAVLKRVPEGELVAQFGPSDRVTATYKPTSIEKIDSTGVIKVSFPEEISGWVALKDLKLQKDQKIVIRYINESLIGTNLYIANGYGKESYHPRFEWYVFSQVEIEGLDALQAAQIEAQAVNSDVPQATTFESSNELINKIDKIWRRSMLDNMHGGVPTDCPHRERIGYTGDGQAVAPTTMMAMGADAFYNKWIRDIREAQKPDGYVANSAPWQPEAGGGIPWGASINMIPFDFYWEYGDLRLLKECYKPMADQTRWMTTWVDPATGVMESRSGHYFKDLGEWVPAYGLPSNALVHTWFLWACADRTAKTAAILGDAEGEAYFTELRDKTAEAFHRAFYNPETGSYGKDGSNVFALAMGVPADREQKVVDALVANIAEHDNHLHTGFVGFRYLCEMLVKHGHADLAYEIINKRDYPSFGWWIEQGATVTWEQWNGDFSHNHPFMGGGIRWFYRDLAGLEPTEPGYRTFEIRPTVVDGLNWVKFTKECPYGHIGIDWNVTVGGAFTLKCEVPVGTVATVYVPDGDSVREEVLTSGRHTLKGSVIR